MTWPGERLEAAPAGAGRADPFTEADAQRLRLLLTLEAFDGWRLRQVVRTAFLPAGPEVVL